MGRGTALALAAAVVALGAAGVLLHRSRPPALRPAPSTRAPAKFPASPQRCATLAHDYRAARDPAAKCGTDAECVTEKRGQYFFGLDGCARQHSRQRSLHKADELAERWLHAGCAHDFEICPAGPAAICIGGRCVERPPAGVPRDWVRRDVARVLTVFVPPDAKPDGTHRIDTAGFELERGDSTFGVDYDTEFSVADVPPPDDDEIERHTRTLAGKQALVVRYRKRRWSKDKKGGTPGGQGVAAYLEHIACRGMCLGVNDQGARLTLYVECRTASGCDAAQPFFHSLMLW